MKKSLKRWQIFGFIFTGLSGVLLHFLYDQTDQSIIVAPFSAVNESIWEHMKLLFFPLFVFTLIEYKYISKNYENFWCAKLIGTTAGLILIPVLYYTYTGVFGVNADWINIVIFFIAAGTAYYIENYILKSGINICRSSFVSFAVLCLFAVIFIVATFVQPKIPLFQDMTTGNYGI